MRQTLADNGIFLLRISVSLLMLSHGIPMALEYEVLAHDFPDPLNVTSAVSLQLVLFAEVGCSILLLLGLLGRFASVALFITMMIAAFVHHFGDPWQAKELPLLYAAVYATLAFTGPGSPSFDAWFSRAVAGRGGPPASAPHRVDPGAPR